MKKLTLNARFVFILLALTTCVLIKLDSVEIPLDKQVTKDGQPIVTMGYVDIEKVFTEHPMTKRLRDEFYKAAEAKKASIKEAQDTIKRLETVIKSSTTQITQLKEELEKLKAGPPPETEQKQEVHKPTMPGQTIEGPMLPDSQAPADSVSVSTSTEAAPQAVDPDVIEAKIKQIAEMEAELLNIKKELEEKKAGLGDILKKNQEDLVNLEEMQTNTILLDIYDILEKVAIDENVTVIVDKSQILYGESAKDLTDKVIERLQGR